MTQVATSLAAAVVPTLSTAVFDEIAAMIYQTAGIRMARGKEDLVRGRIARRLRALGLASFEEYIVRARQDKGELSRMVDVLTTNKTNFFREPDHFEYMTSQLIPKWRGLPSVRIWCAGCSSGEEAYTLAMVLREAGLTGDVKILATDICTDVLGKAKAGIYAEELIDPVPAPLRKKYFKPAAGRPGDFEVSAELKGMISFARLNFMSDWPMRGPFQLVSCRNVMIYFDDATRERLVGRFASLLESQGTLFIGHSESLSALKTPYALIKPATYRKNS
jgi:chemotaxis protein methyltransferase CheR